MSDRQDFHGWSTASELPPEVLALLQGPWTENYPIVLVATVDPDGAPRTAPFVSLRAIGPRTIRFACRSTHDTYANLHRDGRVTAALVAPPNVAVSIRGQATVVKEQMETSPDLAVIEIQVTEVKNDSVPGIDIRTAITIFPRQARLRFFEVDPITLQVHR